MCVGVCLCVANGVPRSRPYPPSPSCRAPRAVRADGQRHGLHHGGQLRQDPRGVCHARPAGLQHQGPGLRDTPRTVRAGRQGLCGGQTLTLTLSRLDHPPPCAEACDSAPTIPRVLDPASRSYTRPPTTLLTLITILPLGLSHHHLLAFPVVMGGAPHSQPPNGHPPAPSLSLSPPSPPKHTQADGCRRPRDRHLPA